jgi:ribonuclease-3
VEHGPDHAKEFSATVLIGGEEYGTGEGRSKKEAEQRAAREAYDRLMGESGRVPAGEA